MTSPLPTSPAMKQLTSDFFRALPPYYWALAQRHIELIRREQDHATLESIRGSVTRPDPAQQDVFDLDAYRCARVMVQDDDPEAA